MERHPTDFWELLFGLAFLATGAGFVVRQATDRTFDASWIAAVALVAIGCVFLAVTVLHRPRSKTTLETAVESGVDDGEDASG